MLGGFVGSHESGTIQNCYAIGTVTGANYVGGLAGGVQGTISNCSVTGRVTGTGDNVGGLVGGVSGGTITNSFWDTTTITQTTSSRGTGKITDELKALTATSASWNENNWDYGTNSQYPALRTYKESGGSQVQGDLFCGQLAPRSRSDCPLVVNAEGKSEITSIEELNSVRDDLAGDYVLINDLDFADGSFAYRPASVASPTDATMVVPEPANGLNPGFTPIGDGTTGFTGTFDGNGFTISNLYINRASTDNIGLFGVVGSGGEVKNVGLVDVYVKGDDRTGGLVGSSSGTINYCYTTGTVSGINRTGGLVGENNSSITNCYATGNTTGTGSYAGGLVGFNSYTITNSYATGNVTGVQAKGGGLVGQNNGTITNCYATGNVIGTRQDIGGLVGDNPNGSSISNCYTTGNITSEVGAGIAGYNEGTITNCYFSGNAPDGIVGDNSGTLTNSFSKTTGQLQALTGDTPSGTPTAATPESGWGELNWAFGGTSQFPALRTYKESGGTQGQGDIICSQPAPRIRLYRHLER